MNPHHHLLLFLSLTFPCSATAQEIIKAKNSHLLNLPTSWVEGVVPGAANAAVWNSVSSNTFYQSAGLGANLFWQGVRFDNFGNSPGSFSITGAHTLTLGSSGIGISNINLRLETPVVFSADTMLVLNTDNKGITFNGSTNLGGHTLSVVSNKITRFLDGSGGLTNGTLRFTSDPHNGQCQFNAASTGDLTLRGTGRAQIIVDNPVVSNPQLHIHLTDDSRLVLGKAWDNQTLAVGNLSGDSGAQIMPDFNFVREKPTVVRTLSANQTIDDIYAGVLTDSNNNRSLGFSKTGGAILTLTHTAHKYTGPTTVNSGTLRIANAGRLNSGAYPAALVIHKDSTLHFDSSSIQLLSGPLSGSGTLRKSNTGFLTFTGDSRGFTGQITVDGGRLIWNGTLGGHLSLSGGASLGGTAISIGSLTTAPGSNLILSGGSSTKAFTFDHATIHGPTYIEFASAQQDAVVYEILRYGAGGITGYKNLIPRARGTLRHDAVNRQVLFTATAPGVRTWKIGDGVWDGKGRLENWTGGDKRFIQGDQVVLGPVTSDTTITLDGPLAPSIVTVENPAKNYTFGGSGGLTGSGEFHKSEAGILRIANANPNYDGPTFIKSGIFRFVDGGNWGTSPITNNAALEAEVSKELTLINGIAGPGTLIKRGPGTLRLAGDAENTFTGDVTVESGRLVLDKDTALGYGKSGAKIVAIHKGAQIDLNDYADTQHKEVKKTELTYTFQIAGDGDGTGAITNTRGSSLRIGTKSFDFAGIANLELTGDASIGGTAGYDVGFTQKVTGTIHGNGHVLTKLGSNTIHLRAPASRISLVVREGILGVENHNDAFGGADGSVTVHTNAILGASGPMIIPTPVALRQGSTLRSLGNWFTDAPPTWAGPITLHGEATLLADPKDLIITGNINGNGGIVKTGIRKLTLTASNTYSGPTTVREGSLMIQRPCLSDTAAVTVATGSSLHLAFTGTDVVASLTLGGQIMPSGIYNSTTHPNLLAGNGSLQVVIADR